MMMLLVPAYLQVRQLHQNYHLSLLITGLLVAETSDVGFADI